jgi:hypothetical protein
MTQQCVNCPCAEDHSTAQCPLVSEQNKDAERAAFEAWLGIKPCGAAHDLAVMAFQAGAAWQRTQAAWVPDGYMPIPTAEQLADALENVRCFHDMSAELIAPELLANLLAALSAQQSAHVSVPRELLERVESHLDRTTFAPFGEPLPPDNTERRELRDNIRALLNGGEA